MAMDFLSPSTVVETLKEAGEIRDEGFSGQGHASWIRSRLWFFHNQRPDAGPW